VLRYVIANNKTNSIDLVVDLDISQTTTPENFTVSYAYTTNSTDLSTNLASNRSSFNSEFTAQELKAGNTAYIYVIFEIANTDLDATFVGSASWTLTDASSIEGNYAEIKSGKYVCSAIKGYANTDTEYNRSNTDVQSITFGSLNEYSSAVSGVSTPIDISANNDGSVKVYRVGSSTYDVYVLATESNTKMKFNTDSSYMFYSCRGLSELDVSNFDTSSVTNMSYMFDGCEGLSTIDLSGWDTSNVTNMSNMFYDCRRLSTIDLSNLDNGSVTNMSYMFYNCTSLTTLDLSDWDTSSVTWMASMFMYCNRLTTIIGIEDWDTSSLTSVLGMFCNCPAYNTLDLSGWDTSSVTDMNYINTDPFDVVG